jgi:HK97 family phage portal protein
METPSPLDFNRLASEGYRVNPIIYGCIRVISQAVAEPTLKALTVDENEQVETDTVVGGDPLAELLMRPNDHQDQFEFYEQLLIHLMFAGNAFIHKIRSIAGNVVGLEIIRPDIMGLIPGENREEGKVRAYTVRINETSFPIPKDDIIHFKLPDALDEFWGLSPIFVLARYGDVDLQSADFLRSYFLNKGIPAGILTFEHPVQKPERERVRDMWKEQFNSVEGWHNLAILDAKVNYQNVQTGIKDVDMDSITNQTETRICAVYGVPPILISALAGISHATFANAEESRKLFWSDTATPLFTRLSKKLTTELAMKEFGDDRRIIFDLTSVPALQENKSELRKIAMQGWNSGLFTRDQTFALLGHAQETTQGTLIKILPGTEFRPIDLPLRPNRMPRNPKSCFNSVPILKIFSLLHLTDPLETSPSGHAPGRIVTNSTKH